MEEEPLAEVTLAMWELWLLNPVTRAVLRGFLPKAMDLLKEQWAAKEFMGETRDEILTLNAAALGEFTAYERLKDLQFEQFYEVMKDD